MHFPRRSLLLGILAALVSACGDATTPGAQAEHGTYVLVRGDDSPVPAVVGQHTEDGTTIEVVAVSGSITLTAGNAFAGSVVFRFEVDGLVIDQETQAFGGIYAITGTQIALTDHGEVVPNVGTISGGVITVHTDEDEEFGSAKLEFEISS